MAELSRGELLSRAGRVGAGLVVGGTVAALVAGPAFGGETPPEEEGPSEEDLASIRLAAAAELLAIDFYARALAARRFSGEVRRYFARARGNELAHYAALAKVLGDGAPVRDDFQFVYPSRTFASRSKTASVGVKLETAFVGAYLGAVASLTDPSLRNVAAQIAASEAQHLSVLSGLANGTPIGSPFPAPLDAEQASDALDPFLGE